MCFEKHCEFYSWLDNDLVELQERIEKLESELKIIKDNNPFILEKMSMAYPNNDFYGICTCSETLGNATCQVHKGHKTSEYNQNIMNCPNPLTCDGITIYNDKETIHNCSHRKENK